MAVRQPATDPTRGVDRVLSVYKELAGHPRGVSLEEMARRVESPKSSVHRALAALRRAGLADQDDHGRYRLGLEALRLAFSYYEGLDERGLVQPVLDDLAARFHETTHYAVLDGTEVVYLAKVEQQGHGVHMSSRVGGRNPAPCTGVGKVLLAFALPGDKAVREYVAEHGLRSRTSNTVTDVEAFVAELARTRERGYAVDDEENEVGVGCVAVPVFIGPGAGPSGAISVTALTHRTPVSRLVGGIEEIRAVIAERLAAGAGA